MIKPGLAPAGDLLSLASPRESKQREGEPDSPSLRWRSGHAALLGLNGVSRKLASLKHASPLIRSTLRYSPTHNGKEFGALSLS
ncbi:hypothetical protein [Limnohabitans lacus]|uniref:Uncharacterized protein n=1 Tax=Limnohabitans lacus TaxID=3045173 RepID=A0ABT6X3V6_9BURK|nr:hypothetical protein [Limnohabitans sp. HM2-2]MDI9232796.1 hypothetical protein [Limnohabitans sp. HM2-2]